MQSTYLPLLALVLLGNKLPKVGGSGCGNVRLAAATGAAGEAGEMGRGKAPGILCMPACLGLCLPSLCPFASAACSVLTEKAGEVLPCVGPLVCSPTKLPLSTLPAFLLAGLRAPGEKGHAMLGGEDTVQPASRPQDGATVLPHGFRNQASLFLHGTKTLLWWSGHVCSWLC